jgi:hypothetical protein
MPTFVIGTKQVAGALGLSLVALALMSGCAGTPESPKTEEPPAAAAIPAAEEPKPEGTVPNLPPTEAEVRAKVTLIFDDAVIVDASRRPDYFIGDFNGDNSQDLALIVRPVEAKLADINSEVANWIVGDPTQVMLPDPHKSVQTPPIPKPVVIERTDHHLLAFIHGHGPDGWRDPLARQTYLLKNAVGRNPTAQYVIELVKASKGKARKPAIYADMSKKGSVIMQSLRGSPGFLYYSGSKYVWYELK